MLLVIFPDTNLRTAKRRPVVVVQADHLRTGLPQFIVAMITSNLARHPHPSRVLITRSTSVGRQSRLLADSVVMPDNLATIAEGEIDRIIGTLSMNAIDTALRHTLGLRLIPLLPSCSQPVTQQVFRAFFTLPNRGR